MAMGAGGGAIRRFCCGGGRDRKHRTNPNRAAHFFDLRGTPSLHYSGNYLIGFEHCEPERPKTHAKTTRRRGQHRTSLQPRQPNTMLHAPVAGPPLTAPTPIVLYLLHTYYTMIVAELGFRMLERDTFHTKLVRY